MFRSTFVIAAFFLFAICSFAQAEMATVKGNNVNLRKGPDKTYQVLWEYGSGFPVEVIKRQGSWVKTKDFENDSGWIHKSLLHYSPQVIVKVNKGTENKINIRTGPSTSYPVVGKALYGVVFKSLEKKSGWIKVSHSSGLEGWIKANLLWGY